MIGLDTNVLVRFLTRDDSRQFERAQAFVLRRCTPEMPGFISTIVLCELVWVLDSGYRYDRALIASTLERLLRTRQFQVEAIERVWQALQLYRDCAADFADCLILRTGQQLGCNFIATFDRKAARLDGFKLIR